MPAIPAPTMTTSAVSDILVLRGPLARRLEDRDPLVHWNARDQLSNDVERQIFSALEPNAGFAHVQLLPGLGKAIAQPALVVLASIGKHQVEGVVGLAAGERDIPERLLVWRIGIP